MLKLGILPMLVWIVVAAPALALHLYQPEHEYTEAEIGELNWFELTLLANEPYARQGYVFDSDFLMNHYLATDWYGPAHGTKEHIEAAMTFSAKEQEDMARFKAAAAKLKPTFDGCWPVASLASLEVKYYRKVSSAKVAKVQLAPEFYDLGAADGVSIWSRPAVASEDALDEEPAAGDYYRVYLRDGGTIAAVEARGESEGKPETLWTAWFDEEGALRLFHAVSKRGGWTSKVAIASFAGSAADTRPRCLIHGDMSRIDMEVRGGPYARLPFTVPLYEEHRDGGERYKELVGD
jgi:hypothetical protein